MAYLCSANKSTISNQTNLFYSIMNQLLKVLLFILAFTSTITMQAQGTNVRNGKDALETSELMVAFQKAKSAIETHGLNAKTDTSLPEDKKTDLKIVYDNTVIEMNNVLKQMKNDLKSAQQRKIIKKNPQVYEQGKIEKINASITAFNQNFLEPYKAAKAVVTRKKAAADAAAGKETVFLETITVDLVLTLVAKGYSAVKAIINDQQKLTEAYLEEKFYQPNALSTWNALK
jgi:hypothetical protein